MNPLTVATISCSSALLFGAGSLWLELSGAPPSPLLPAILERLPQIVPAIVAVYAVLILLTTTAAFIIACRRVRSRLKSASAPNRELWDSIFSEAGLSRLGSRLISAVPAKSIAPPDQIFVDGSFGPRAARHEIIRQYQDWLWRGQFFTALAVLAGVVAFGLAEQYGLVRSFNTPVATASIIAESLGLIFLAAYLRLAVDAAAEPLIDVIVNLPLERLDISLLNATLTTFQRGRSKADSETSTRSSYPGAEGLARLLSRGQRTFEKTASELLKSVEVVASASRVLADQSQSARDAGIDLKTLSDLQSAIERLASIIDRLPSMGQTTVTTQHEPTTIEPMVMPSQTARGNDLGIELRRLLNDLE